MALGATSNAVIGMSLRQGAGCVSAGVVVASIGAWLVTRSLESTLFGVSAGDTRTFAAAICLLMASAVSAVRIPARQAASVAPAQALRNE